MLQTKTDNGEAAQPRLYSIHLLQNPLFTDSNGAILTPINDILHSRQPFDFGYVEDDGSITSADHSNMKNNPATFIQSTPEEWASQVDPQNLDNYDVELWCVVCNDNQIQYHQCEKRHTSNFFK